MSAAINVHEAKTHLSRLLDRAHAGEEITISKAGKPWAKLVKIEEAPKVKRQPGGWPVTVELSLEDAMSSAMTDADIDAWEQKLRDM